LENDMSEPVQPSVGRTLRRIWQGALPHDSGAVAFAPSGERLVVGTDEYVNGSTAHSLGSLTVFDTRTGDVLRHLDNGSWGVNSLAFSRDGRRLATAEARSTATSGAFRVRVLDAETLDEHCSTRLLDGPAESLTFSRDGAWIAARSEVHPISVAYLFSTADGTQRWRREIGPRLPSLAVSPDSGRIALSCHRDGIAVLDTLTGTELRRITTPSEVLKVVYSPDARSIVAACEDGMIRVFNADTGAPVWSARLAPVGIAATIVSVVVSADAQWVAAVTNAQMGSIPWDVGLLGVYDLAQGTLRYPPVKLRSVGDALYSPTLRHITVNALYGWPDPPWPNRGFTVVDARTGLEDSSVNILTFNPTVAPDGRSIAATVGSYIDLYDLGLEVSRYAVGASLTSIGMSATGTPLVAVADTSSAVTVVAATSGIRLARKPVPGTIADTVFVDGGQAVAVGGSTGVRLFPIIGGPATGESAWTLDTIGTVNALAATGPGGEWIAAAAGRTVQLFSSADGHTRWPRPNTHPQTVTRVAASNDGSRIATGCADRNARLIDAHTGAEVLRVGGDGKVQAVVFQPNGSLLAVGNEDGTVVLVDAVTSAVRGRVTRLLGCTRVAFSFDSTLLAVAWDDNNVSVYDITSFPSAQVREFPCSAPVSALAFSPAENSVAIATAAASITVRDARSGIELARIPHPQPVRHLAFSGDGALISTTSEDNVIRVWRS
jgi:WD40 repeat protein